MHIPTLPWPRTTTSQTTQHTILCRRALQRRAQLTPLLARSMATTTEQVEVAQEICGSSLHRCGDLTQKRKAQARC